MKSPLINPLLSIIATICLLGCADETKRSEASNTQSAQPIADSTGVTGCNHAGKTYDIDAQLPDDQIAATENTLQLFQQQSSAFNLSTVQTSDECTKLGMFCSATGNFIAKSIPVECEKSCTYRGRKYPTHALIDIVTSTSTTNYCSKLQTITCNASGEVITSSTNCTNHSSNPEEDEKYIKFERIYKGTDQTSTSAENKNPTIIIRSLNDLVQAPGLQNVKLENLDFNNAALIGIKVAASSKDSYINIDQIIRDQDKLYLAVTHEVLDPKTCTSTSPLMTAYEYIKVQKNDLPELSNNEEIAVVFTQKIKECDGSFSGENQDGFDFKTIQQGSVISSELKDGDYLITSAEMLEKTLAQITVLDIDAKTIDFEKDFVMYGQRTYGGPIWQKYAYKTIRLDSKEIFPQAINVQPEISEYVEGSFFKPHIAFHLIAFPKNTAINENSTLNVSKPIEIK